MSLFVSSAGLPADQVNESRRLINYMMDVALLEQLRCIRMLVGEEPIAEVPAGYLLGDLESHAEACRLFGNALRQNLALDHPAISGRQACERLRARLGMDGDL